MSPLRIDIESLEILAGELAPRAARLVGEWAREHRDELRQNWERARRHESLQPIEPLRDLEFFRRLRADAEAGTIVWPNAADIPPERLYAHAQRRAAATA